MNKNWNHKRNWKFWLEYPFYRFRNVHIHLNNTLMCLHKKRMLCILYIYYDGLECFYDDRVR